MCANLSYYLRRIVQVGASTYEQHSSRSSCTLASHQSVRAQSTAARLRSSTRISARASTRTAGTVLPAPPFAFVFAWRSHITPLPPCIRPRHPYREVCQQPQQPRLLELRPSEAVQAPAHVRLAHDPRRVHGGNVHVCSTEAFRCAWFAREDR